MTSQRANTPPEPSGPTYHARVALSCSLGQAPGPVLHALQEMRSGIDDRLRHELGSRYDRHAAQSVGADTPMGAKAAELYEKFDAAGNGGLDFSAIVRALGKS